MRQNGEATDQRIEPPTRDEPGFSDWWNSLPPYSKVRYFEQLQTDIVGEQGISRWFLASEAFLVGLILGIVMAIVFA